MSYVYLDESGDVGFNFRSGSSRHLIITLLIVDEKFRADRCLKRIRKKKLKKSIKQLPELKFNNSTDWIRKKVLQCIKDVDPDIAYIVLKKKTIYNYLRPYPSSNKLYNYIAGLLIEEVIPTYRGIIKIIIDKRFSKRVIQEDFEQYLLYKLDYPMNVHIIPENSQNDRGLQAVDFVSGAIFRKYESGDTTYYDIIKDQIIWELKLFKR